MFGARLVGDIICCAWQCRTGRRRRFLPRFICCIGEFALENERTLSTWMIALSASCEEHKARLERLREAG